MSIQTDKKPPHLSPPTPEFRKKLERSYMEVDGLTLRDVKCPHCRFVITRVYSDIQGHYLAKCRKCKSEMILNLAYFRRQKGIGKLKQKYYGK